MKASYACLGIQRAAKQSHVCLACLSIFSPHPSRFHSSSARSLCCRFSVAPDANAYAFTSIHPLSHVSLSLSSLPFRVFRHCIKKFSSSSASPPSPARLSAAPRSRRSCRRRPSSPPTSASRRSASRLPLPWSSLLSCVVSFLNLARLLASMFAYLLRGNLQTRHPPRAVRRASAVGGVGWCLLSPRQRLWLCSGFLALRPTWFEEFCG